MNNKVKTWVRQHIYNNVLTRSFYEYIGAIKNNMNMRLSDEEFISQKYHENVGGTLDLNDPKTFCEKLQWIKLNDRKEIYTKMADKYEAKRYIEEKVGAKYNIPLLGVYETWDDINFDDLPQQFVLKCNHDSGKVFICRDRGKFDFGKAKREISKSLGRNYYYNSREWPYKNIKPRIIAEKYMQNALQNQLIDYKFYCFNGEPQFLYVSIGWEDHRTVKLDYIDLNWNIEPFYRRDVAHLESLPPKPKCFEKMITIARKLAQGTLFLRVDLYEIEEEVYVGELTFFPGGGFTPFYPQQYNEIIGDMIRL